MTWVTSKHDTVLSPISGHSKIRLAENFFFHRLFSSQSLIENFLKGGHLIVGQYFLHQMTISAYFSFQFRGHKKIYKRPNFYKFSVNLFKLTLRHFTIKLFSDGFYFLYEPFHKFFWSVKSIGNGNFQTLSTSTIHSLSQRLQLRLMFWGLSKTLWKKFSSSQLMS